MKASFLSQALGLCALLSLGAVLQAQTTLGIQDFENPNVASPVWGFTNTGGGFVTGSSSGTSRPANSPNQVSGARGFQVNNGTATLTFSSINTGAYTNIRFTARLASMSVNNTNGADVGDRVTVEVSTNGGVTWVEQLRVSGNNNACWGFADGIGLASTNFGSPLSVQTSAGGLRTTDGYSSLEINSLPAVADLRVRITLLNNDGNERWVIDDVKLEGDPISCTVPTTQASATTAPTASVTATSIDLNWTSGNGLRRLVVARQGSAVTATPVNGSTYTAGAFGTGSDLGSGQFVVYEGTGSSTSLSGLIPGTVYHFAVFEYNCAGASSVYNTSLGAGNRAQAQTRPANVALTPGCLSASSFDLSWTLPAGDYDGIVIFARENLAPASPITDETTFIGANSNFALAPTYGARGSLVYKGTGTNVTITGLTPGASYIFRAFTYKNSVASVWSTGTQTGQTMGLVNVTAAGAVGTGSQTLDLGWVNPTAGCWDEILVVVNNAPGISFVPTGDGSAYSANPTYSGNNQVVYQGTGNAVSLDGLTAGTLYYFEIFVRRGNSWSSGIEVVGTPSQILRSGDLMIIGFDNNTGSGVDFFSIVTLVDLYPGTQFILANACYELFAAANTRTDRWYACDGNGTKALAAQLFTYMGTTPLTAGSVICMNLPTTSAATNLSINGTATTDISVSQIPGIAMNVNFSTGDPDAIFLMQGTFTEQIDHYTFAGRILSGIQDGATWYAFSDNLTTLGIGAPRRRSRIPADIECFAIQGSTSSVTYRTRYTGIVIGSQAELIGLIVNYASNWTTGANYNCSQPFTVSGTYAANIWTGAADENWFNCANWLNRVVPDETTDVAIGMNPVPTPARDAHINPAAPFADRYNFVAKTRNLNINIRQVQLQNAAELQVHGSLVLSAAGSLDLSTSASNALYLHGDWDNQISSAAFSEGGEVHLVGTQDQIIATNDPAGEEMFETLIINKASGRVQNFCNYLMITEAMRFDQGIVDNIGGALVYFEPNAQALNASDLSHVNGAVLKNTFGIGGGYFVYPTGKGGHYGAIGLMAQSGLMGEIYQAEYFHNGYGTYNLDPTCLDHVSLLEYWNVEEFFGGTGEQVQLTLHWTPYSRVFDPADLRIAHYFPVGANPLQWNCEPHINISGVSASGTITSDWLSQFSPFTFGTPVDDTSLPLELLSFEAQRQGQTAQIFWVLAKEEAGVRYFVERSAEPTQGFKTIAELQGQGRLSYAQLDNSPLQGWNYYRLRQIEADGSVDYSPIRALFFEGKASDLEVFPNPSQGQAFVRGLEGEVEVEVLNTLGQRLSRFQIQTQAGQATSLPLDELPAGSYYLRFLSAQGQAQTLWIKR